MYGTQTDETGDSERIAFENDVKMYGTQTEQLTDQQKIRLRMM